MEDDQNGRRPKWKTTKIEDNQNGRRSKWKTTKMEDDQNGRRPKWKTSIMEDDQNGIQPKWKQRRIKLGYFQRVRVLHIFALRDFFTKCPLSHNGFFNKNGSLVSSLCEIFELQLNVKASAGHHRLMSKRLTDVAIRPIGMGCLG